MNNKKAKEILDEYLKNRTPFEKYVIDNLLKNRWYYFSSAKFLNSLYDVDTRKKGKFVPEELLYPKEALNIYEKYYEEIILLIDKFFSCCPNQGPNCYVGYDEIYFPPRKLESKIVLAGLAYELQLTEIGELITKYYKK